MKTLSGLVIVVFGFASVRTSSFAESGWFWENPQPQGNPLLGVATLDASTAVAVGFGGTIIRTDDGGATWTRQSSGTVEDLRAVSFVDANTGTAVGDNGTILRTDDGGHTWTRQTSGTTVWLWGVSFVNARIGTASCSSVGLPRPLIVRCTELIRSGICSGATLWCDT